MIFIRTHPEGIVFKVFVQPRSSKNKIVGAHRDAIKVKVTAPPVGGAANEMCIKFLAKLLGTPPGLLEIISGHNNRNKKILMRSNQANATQHEQAHFRRKVENLIGN